MPLYFPSKTQSYWFHMYVCNLHGIACMTASYQNADGTRRSHLEHQADQEYLGVYTHGHVDARACECVCTCMHTGPTCELFLVYE
jgi:hypothetical protein